MAGQEQGLGGRGAPFSGVRTSFRLPTGGRTPGSRRCQPRPDGGCHHQFQVRGSGKTDPLRCPLDKSRLWWAKRGGAGPKAPLLMRAALSAGVLIYARNPANSLHSPSSSFWIFHFLLNEGLVLHVLACSSVTHTRKCDPN